MFNNMEHTDLAKIGQGILALVFVVVLGVIVAETQLNNLTHQHEFAQAFYLMRDNTGQYSTYVFGNSLNIKAVYPVAKIDNKEILIMIAGQHFILPLQIDFDSQKILSVLKTWYKQFISEALFTKQNIHRYLTEFSRDLTRYMNQFR
ncbi:hypothetical protein SPFL3102_00184 [Sporomusaceae bacterium FL31]|nr:hypothetical protein SPFL3101_01676 [Sporomusaceae bacterium FL31]GCE32409.1 hypothetical protein SPFL3102_00184 [Sporomusaceae bacterium]